MVKVSGTKLLRAQVTQHRIDAEASSDSSSVPLNMPEPFQSFFFVSPEVQVHEEIWKCRSEVDFRTCVRVLVFELSFRNIRV